MAKYICLLKDSDNPKDLMLNVYMKSLLKISNFKNQSKFTTWHYSIKATTWYLRNKKVKKTKLKAITNWFMTLSIFINEKIEQEAIINLDVL